MDNRTILISGAGIAGPALAYWLGRSGFQPTVVEQAPALREGGYAVDFRGPAHLSVLQRMGILEKVRRRQTNMGEVTVVDAAGKPLLRMPASFISGEVEILRGDLSRILYDRTSESTEYLFGDAISSLRETSAGVDVTFEQGDARTFDLVVGADGMHSRVRALAFGPEGAFIRHSGYAIADFTVPNFLGLDHAGLIYNEPGCGVMVTSARNRGEASVGLVFFVGSRDGDLESVERQKARIAETFRGLRWQTPSLIEAMWDVPDLYFDTISQVHIDRFSSSRVALLGDAGYGATVGGLGTGLAIVCAYVLAGELAAANGDYHAAFIRYEEQIRGYVRGCQKIGNGVGPFLAPRTRAAIWRRNQMYRLLSIGPMADYFNRLSTKAASAITLKVYPEPQRPRGSGRMLMSAIG